MTRKSVFKYGELFCGAGGLALGVLRAHVRKGKRVYRLEHQWANDIDVDAVATYRHNIAPTAHDTVLSVDVRDFIHSDLFDWPIDVLGFGFPCNDFSIVGERKGLKGVFGPLYTYGVHALNRHNPLWFIAENVSGLRNSNDGLAFRLILEELQKVGEHGYNVTPHLYKFEEYGIPQKRHRIIIIGIRSDQGKTFSVPAPITRDPKTWKTARDALKDIPEDALNQEHTNHSDIVLRRLEHLEPGQNAWHEDLPPELQLNVKAAKLSQIYKILDPDQPAYTITGSGGGGTHGYHWGRPRRALTNRERARLQTFPDDFEFTGGKESQRRQIGMAVPPKAAEMIVEAVLKTYAGEPYDSVAPNLTEFIEKQLDLL